MCLAHSETPHGRLEATPNKPSSRRDITDNNILPCFVDRLCELTRIARICFHAKTGMQHSISETEIPDRVGRAHSAWSFFLALICILITNYRRYRANPREFVSTRRIFGMGLRVGMSSLSRLSYFETWHFDSVSHFSLFESEAAVPELFDTCYYQILREFKASIPNTSHVRV